MFFKKCKKARLFARGETNRTHRRHIVKPCKKYTMNGSFGRDYINGFTVILVT